MTGAPRPARTGDDSCWCSACAPSPCWPGALALLADAGHMLSDVSALSLSVFAISLAQRPKGPQQTYGHHRTEILAALANGILLVGGGGDLDLPRIRRAPRAPDPNPRRPDAGDRVARPRRESGRPRNALVRPPP